jgi:hypothetical protein
VFGLLAGSPLSAQTYAINTTTLSSFSGVHPKLYLDTAKIAQLQAIMANPPANTRWPAIKTEFYSKVNGYQSKNPEPAGYDDGDITEAWQEINGQAMFGDAMAYVVTGNATYLQDALRWSKASISYPTWGKATDGPMGKQAYDLTAAYELHGLAVLYDWCYSALAANYPSDLVSIRNALATRGQGVYEAASGTNPTATTPQWWGQEWEQNHLWIAETGMTAAALAIYGDSGAPSNATIATWLQDGMSRWNNTFLYRGTDGADLEGPGYWRYGLEWSFRYFDFAQKILGANMWNDPWNKATGSYRLYFSTAANYWYNTTTSSTTDYVDFADSDRKDGSSYIFRKLASEYGDTTMQWMAEEMDTAGNGLIDPSPRDAPLNLLWYDSSVAEVAPGTAGLPVSKLFNDLNFNISRSDWSGNESVVAFQSGPPMGQVVLNSSGVFDSRSAPHPHPAANNFSIFGDGEWLIRNAGYAGQKFAGQENTLLVAGLGQMGEQTPIYTWYNMQLGRYSSAAIDTSVSVLRPELDYYAADAAGTYDASRGVTKFRRRMIYLRPDVLIVLDSIALNVAEALELRFFPEQQTVTGGSGQYAMVGNTSQLAFTLLTTAATSATTKSVAMEDENGGAISRIAFSLAPTGGGTASSWENAVAFSWTANTGIPKSVSMVNDDSSAWKFFVTDGTSPEMVIVNKSTEAVTLVVGTPPAPAGLTAADGNAQAVLGWTAAASATSYNVKRATVSGGPYSTIATGVTATSFTDPGLINGTIYYYVVSASNQLGEGYASNQAVALPIATTAIGISPASLLFIPQTAGTTSPSIPVMVGNMGSTAINVTSIVASAGFSQTNNCGSSISASSSCIINVRFSPTTAGALTGTIQLADSDVTGRQTIPLSGTAYDLTATNTGVAAVPIVPIYGQAVTLTATVPGNGSSLPSGAVTFKDGNTVLGPPVTLTAGSASSTVSFVATGLMAGTHTISAVYSGDAIFAGSTGTLSLSIAVATSATSVSVAPSASTVGAPVTFTATVVSNLGTPSGSVQFYDGSTAMGGAQTLTGGVATFNTSALTAGAHSITAVYAGTTIYPTSTSLATSITVNAVLVPDFTLQLADQQLTIGHGTKSTSTTVSITAVNGFSFPIIFSCSGLPASTSCSFSPATVIPSGSASSILTIQTSLAENTMPHLRFGLYGGGITLALALLIFPSALRKRRVMQLLAMILMLAAGMQALSGCGIASTTPNSITSAVTVSGVSSSSTHTATLTLVTE